MKLIALLNTISAISLTVFTLQTSDAMEDLDRRVTIELAVTHAHMKDLELRTRFLEEKVCQTGHCF